MIYPTLTVTQCREMAQAYADVATAYENLKMARIAISRSRFTNNASDEQAATELKEMANAWNDRANDKGRLP